MIKTKLRQLKSNKKKITGKIGFRFGKNAFVKYGRSVLRPDKWDNIITEHQ